METAAYYEFDVPDDGFHGWIGVRGTAVPHPMWVRVKLLNDGPRVVAMQIDGDVALTGAALREIRLGELVEHLSAHLRELSEVDLDYPASADHQLNSPQEYQPTAGSLFVEAYLAAYSPESVAARRPSRAQASTAQPESRASSTHPPSAGRFARGRGASAPTSEDLEAFATVLGDERVTRPHGAVTRTARRIGVDRSTAHRWITRCRDAGLITAGADQ